MTLKELFGNDNFARLAGARLITVKPGYAVAEMTITDAVINASGMVQGGALFTLADLAFAAAVNTHGDVTVSTYSNIAFLKSVKEGTLRAEAREIFDHHRQPYAIVNITDGDGNLVAVFTSGGYRKSSAHFTVDALE